MTVADAVPVPDVALTESTVATVVLFDAKEIVTPPMGWPNWSRACAVNCWVCPASMVAEVGEIVTLDSVGVGGLTVSVACGLLTVVVPLVACAVMCAVPWLCPVTVAVAMPVPGSVVMESTVAMFVASDAKVIVAFVTGCPN